MKAVVVWCGIVCGLLLGAGGAGARPVTSLDLLTLQDVAGQSISPNGRYIIFQVHQANATTNSYSNRWVLLDTKSRRQRTLIADGGEPTLASAGDWQAFAPVWAGDSQSLYYVRQDRKRTSLHRVTLAGEDRAIALADGEITDLRPDGQGAAYVAIDAPSGETRAAASDQQQNGMLLALGHPAWLQRKINQFAPWMGPPNFKPATVAMGYDVDFASGAVRRQPQAPSSLYPASNEATRSVKNVDFFQHSALSPDRAHEVFSATLRPHDWNAVYVAAQRGGPAIRITRLGSEPIRQIDWAPDSKRVYYLQADHYTNQNIFVADVARGTSRQLTHVDGYLDGCSYASRAYFATCTIEYAQRPQEIALVNLQTGAVDTLTTLNAEFDALDKTRTEKLVWTDKDGDTMFAVLTYPRNYQPGTRYPVIITTYRAHGFLRGAVGDEYPVMVFAANGFFVISLDIYNTSYAPLAIGDERPFSQTILDWQSPLDGIEQILGTLDSRGLIDPHKVGISGLSHGTEITNYAITHAKNFAAAISDGGSARDPLFYYLKSESWNTLFTAWGLDGPPYGANLPKWKMMSPALNADRVNAPLLMNAPDAEYVIGLQLYWELRDHKKPVEMWIFPNENHIKHQPVHRLVVYNRNLDWFRFWLQGYEDPNPSKASQYRRWEALRK